MRELEPFIARLNNVQLFTQVGQEFVAQLQFDFSPLPDWKRALRKRGSNNQSNAFLQGQNLFSKRVGDADRKERQKWNAIASEARYLIEEEVIPLIRPQTDTLADSVGGQDYADYLLDTIYCDYVIALIEHAFSDIVEPAFFTEILRVYEAGHFPAGWDEVWPGGKLWIY